MYNIYFDIETISIDWTPAHDLLVEQRDPPRTYKKKEVIDTWRKSQVYDSHAKLALQPGGARVVCIVADSPDHGQFQRIDDDERKLLGKFHIWLALHDKGGCRFAGFNIRKFDVPVLCAAYMRNSMPIPSMLKHALMNKYHCEDYMDMFPNAGTMQWLANNLGLDPFPGTGSQVSTWWEAGNTEAILRHCLDDVRILRELGDLKE